MAKTDYHAGPSLSLGGIDPTVRISFPETRSCVFYRRRLPCIALPTGVSPPRELPGETVRTSSEPLADRFAGHSNSRRQAWSEELRPTRMLCGPSAECPHWRPHAPLVFYLSPLCALY